MKSNYEKIIKTINQEIEKVNTSCDFGYVNGLIDMAYYITELITKDDKVMLKEKLRKKYTKEEN